MVGPALMEVVDVTTLEPAAQGWYPDEHTGGSRFWDGQAWTPYVRPPRRRFAAGAFHPVWGVFLGLLGIAGIFSAPDSFREAQAEAVSSPLGAFLGSALFGAALIAGSIYLLRGRGPTTRSVRARVARSGAGEVARPAPSTIHINVTGLPETESVAVAQIRAISDPQTAKALQNLQNLLYTRAISQAEYQAAKNKLLGDL